MSPSEIYGSSSEQNPEEGEHAQRPEHGMSDRLGAVYGQMQPPERTPDGRFVIRFGDAGDEPLEESASDEDDEPGGSGAVETDAEPQAEADPEAADPVERYEQIIREGDRRPAITTEPRRRLMPEIPWHEGEPIELAREELEDHLKYDLPDFGVPPNRERGKPTSLIVIGDRGIEHRIDSGTDERSEKVTEIISELGLKPSGERVETHSEAKLLIDLAEGRVPDRLTAIANNKICGSEEDDGSSAAPSCNTLLRAVPAWMHELTGKDISILVYNNDMTGFLYKNGERDASPPW